MLFYQFFKTKRQFPKIIGTAFVINIVVGDYFKIAKNPV